MTVERVSRPQTEQPIEDAGAADVLLVQVQRLQDRLRHYGLRVRGLPTAHETLTAATLSELAEAVGELGAAAAVLSQQRQASSHFEAALERERRRYRELFDSLPDPCFVTDRAGMVQEANRAVSSLLGFARSYCLGKPLAAFAFPADAPLLETLLARAASLGEGGSQEAALRFRPKRHQAPTHVSLHISPVFEPEATLAGHRVLVHDISAQTRRDEEFARLAAEFDERVRTRTADLAATVKVQAALIEQLQAASPAAHPRTSGSQTR